MVCWSYFILVSALGCMPGISLVRIRFNELKYYASLVTIDWSCHGCKVRSI